MKIMLVAGVLLLNFAALAQPGLQPGMVVNDFAVDRVLNQGAPVQTFRQLQGRLTILDFFGTWCVPCIKALPRLTSVQQQFANDVRVVLVSIEAEDKLQQFISRQKAFGFPVIVDADQKITALFQPPAYPYTVVVNKNGKLLAITEAEQITASQVQQWLQDTATFASGNNNLQQSVNTNRIMPMQPSSNAAVQLSQQFMYAARTADDSVTVFADALKAMDYAGMRKLLASDAEKKAFWINVYNGYVQHLLRNNPDLYQNRNRFFGAQNIKIAGRRFSLDDIEHGILRRSKIKWSLGYMNKLFPGKTEKELRVGKLDHRIHFALNCGAKSCPPIAYYRPENLDSQLALAQKAYLTSEAIYDSGNNQVAVPAILSWFRADFGGKAGILRLLQQEGVVPNGKQPRIRFKKYDWTLYLDNHKNENQ